MTPRQRDLYQLRDSLRPAVLQLCRKRPEPIRELCLAVLGALFTDGHPLRELVAWSDVPGKEGDDNRERTMRDEFYRCVALMLCKLIAHVDIVTSDICRDEDKSFVGIKVETLAEFLTRCQRAAERCLFVIHRAGLLKSTQRAEAKADGTWRGHTSVRKFSVAQLLAVLGTTMTDLGERIAWASYWPAIQRAIGLKRKAAADADPQRLAAARLRDQGRQNAQERARRAGGHGDARSLGSLLRGVGARAGPKPA